MTGKPQEERENKNNILYYCKDHAPKPIKYEVPLEDLVGSWVKKAFTDPSQTDVANEHMWVKIESVAGKTLIGYLDNVPAHVTNIKLHDPVTLDREEIEAMTSPNSPEKAS